MKPYLLAVTVLAVAQPALAEPIQMTGPFLQEDVQSGASAAAIAAKAEICIRQASDNGVAGRSIDGREVSGTIDVPVKVPLRTWRVRTKVTVKVADGSFSLSHSDPNHKLYERSWRCWSGAASGL
jgi:hypothetical protein